MCVFNLYDEVIDKVTGQKAIIVCIANKLVDDCYLIEPLNHSYLPDWREINQLIRYKISTLSGANSLPAELII